MSTFDALALANKDYVAEQYRRYREDPSGVDERWALFFAGFDLALDGGGTGDGAGAAAPAVTRPSEPVLGAFDLVHSYRELGHLEAHLNPLEPKPLPHLLLDPKQFGFGEADLDRVVDVSSTSFGPLPLRELIARLKATYCGRIGVEYLHIPDKEQREWLQERMEPTQNRVELTAAERVAILEQLVLAEGFEQFLHARYPTSKRFSLEGADSLIPMLQTLVEEAAVRGVQELQMGMAHRGRLNVLVNVLRKPYEMAIAEFEGSQLAREATGDGDVKYHLGYSRNYETRHGHQLHLSLSPNPSHLEAIDPIIEGMVRAKQNYLGDTERVRVVPIVIHGDAAFTGQGIVSETLWLSELDGYRTGGTVHVVVNNNIGFTTNPRDYRFTTYPTDVAKIVQAPVFHVNGDDPEACVHAARLAMAFRQRFRVDVVVDLVSYRRYGHNELDDPTFTQPVLYRRIAEHPTPLTLYRQRLVAEGVVTDAQVDERIADFKEILDAAQDYARDFAPRQQVFAFGGRWQGLGWAGDDWSAQTAVPKDVLLEISQAFTRLPVGFTPHARVARLMADRRKMVEDDGPIDWGCGEALAFGSLCVEGTAVRMTGQDARRGTFSHRHGVLVDAETAAEWVPLDHIRDGQGRFLILDSMLSENACLGFEFGFSCADPLKLVVWEAQFGDFVNGAQVIIDQFISASESKWQRMSGLVMLLPHGYEGQGPEHSSARLERFLQLCAEDNLQVVYPTTPAQLFHALRRQMHRTFRKPLVVMSPKSMLRHKLAVSPLSDFTDGTFHTVLDDPGVAGAVEAGVTIQPGEVQRIVFCTGKLFYALLAGRRERETASAAVVRVEQLYPFPTREIQQVLRSYPNARQLYWAQEEPRNMGAWTFIDERLESLLDGRTLSYVGRQEAASPATGSYKDHQAEEASIVQRVFARL
jgi:2-oxoglutarate dehydrogenase E1 component